MLLKTLSELMMDGFSFQESLQFLMKLYKAKHYQSALNAMYDALSDGKPLYQVFQDAKLSNMTISQIKLSQLHGDLAQTLSLIASHMENEQMKVHQLWRLLAYPIILMTMVIGLLFAMKWYLFPQIDTYLNTTHNMGYWFVNHFSLLFGMMVISLMLLYLLFRYMTRKMEVWRRYQLYLYIPFVRSWCKMYCTYYFCYEWGRLLQLGIDTRVILNELQKEGHPEWLQWLSEKLEEGMEQGKPLSEQLRCYPFFNHSLFAFVKEGEMKSQLGSELLFYAEMLWKEWMITLERWLSWIQPLVFILIGVMIVSLYASILLPMYQSF